MGLPLRAAAPVVTALRHICGWRLWTLVLAALACAGPALAQSPALRLGGADSFPLAGHLEVFEDPEGTLDLAEVRTRAFEPLSGDFSVGYSRAAWWLRARLDPGKTGAGVWYLALNAPYADIIDAYVPEREGTAPIADTHKRTGARAPLATRDLITNTFTVRLVLAPETPAEIYLRFSGARSLNAKPVLWRLPAFVKHQTLHVLMVALAMGAALITSVGSVIFGVWLRNRQFVWYGAYVGATALVFFQNLGFLPLVLDGLSPAAVLRVQGVVACLSIMTGAFMIRSIFCPEGRHRLLSRFIFLYGAAAAVGIPVSAAGYYGVVAPMLMAGVLSLALVVPVIAALQMRWGDPASIWYFVGFSSYAIATFWFALVVFGVAPPTEVMEWGHQSIGLLHMAAVFAGLAAALRAGARERRALQARLLAASQQNTLALERAVAERTAALQEEIVARQVAEAALRVALREQRNFLVMVSHEFRTPLATVRAAIALIERGSQGMSEKLQREAGKIVRAVARLSALIDTFLTEELIQQAAMRLDIKPFDLAAVATQLAQDLACEAGRPLRIAGLACAPVEADPVLVRSVVENLVGNAIKHGEGEIGLAVQPAGDGFRLDVSDLGPGIAPDEQVAVFERYYRSLHASSRPGAGIGLHVAKRVVEMHGGTITLSSKAGTGSTFSVFLPRRPPAPPLPPAHGD